MATKVENVLRALRIPEIWNRGFNGFGVRLGHLDTGLDGDYEALDGALGAFAFVDEDGSLSSPAPIDSNGHGTHVAGLVCGCPVEGRPLGVAPGAKLYSACVLEGGHSIVRALVGLDWLLDHDVSIVLIVLGIPGRNRIFENAVDVLRQRDILVVAPIGNGGKWHTRAPGCYPGVLGVGAIDEDDRVLAFSAGTAASRNGRGAKPDLVAPGEDLVSARRGGGLESRSGTSMAAALVAGVAALLRQACPEATAEEIRSAMVRTCRPLSSAESARAGNGIIDPVAALAALTGEA